MLTAPFSSKHYEREYVGRRINRVPRNERPYPFPQNKEEEEANRVNAAKILGGVYSKLVEDNQAEVRMDKMSFVVTKPGFFYYYNLFKRTGQWDTILFTEPGRYSLVSIYRQAEAYGWDYFYRGAFNARTLEEIGGSYEASKYSYLLRTIPAKERSTRLLAETEYGKFLLGELESFIKEQREKEAGESSFPDGTLEIDGRVPLFFTSSTNDDGYSVEKFFILVDGIFKKHMPFKVKKDHDYYLYSQVNGVLYRNYPNFGNEHKTPLAIAFYKDGEISYSNELMDKLYDFFAENPNPLKTKKKTLKPHIKKFFTQPKPSAFKEKFDKYMRDKGLGGFTANEVVAGVQAGFWTKFNFELANHTNERTIDIGYYVNVSYDGKKIIGPESQHNGWLFVTEDGDKIRLVHSAWCQHVTAWSSYSAHITDQKYSVWCIADWLSGPWAERFELNVKEAPTVFMGNKFRTEGSKKKDALAELRRRINGL